MNKEEPSPARPIYSKVYQDDGKATKLYMICVNEGWRQSIVCNDMYEWAADWMLTVLQNKPFAPNYRPDNIGK